MSDAPRDLLREVITDVLPNSAYTEKKTNIDNLVELEKEVYKTPYSDETTTTFYKKHNDLLNAFNSYVITNNTQFIGRLKKLKELMDEVVKNKDQILSNYDKVEISYEQPKIYDPNTTYYEIVMSNKIDVIKLGKIIKTETKTRVMFDYYTEHIIEVTFDSGVKKEADTLLILYKTKETFEIEINGGRKKNKSTRRKISHKRRKRVTNKKRRNKK